MSNANEMNNVVLDAHICSLLIAHNVTEFHSFFPPLEEIKCAERIQQTFSSKTLLFDLLYFFVLTWMYSAGIGCISRIEDQVGMPSIFHNSIRETLAFGATRSFYQIFGDLSLVHLDPLPFQIIFRHTDDALYCSSFHVITLRIACMHSHTYVEAKGKPSLPILLPHPSQAFIYNVTVPMRALIFYSLSVYVFFAGYFAFSYYWCQSVCGFCQ